MNPKQIFTLFLFALIASPIAKASDEEQIRCVAKESTTEIMAGTVRLERANDWTQSLEKSFVPRFAPSNKVIGKLAVHISNVDKTGLRTNPNAVYQLIISYARHNDRQGLAWLNPKSKRYEPVQSTYYQQNIAESADLPLTVNLSGSVQYGLNQDFEHGSLPVDSADGPISVTCERVK